MGKLLPCDFCKKSHHTFAARDKCETKHKRAECQCPIYWRKRWPNTHSYPHGCPLAE